MKTATTKTPGMLLPKNTIVKTQSAATSSIPPSSSIPKRPIGWIPYGPERPCGAYYLFMLEFRKTVECESAVEKAAIEKWASLTEAEKSVYEVKVLERRSRYVKYIEAARELKRKQDVNDGEAKAAPSTEKANPDVDATEGDSS